MINKTRIAVATMLLANVVAVTDVAAVALDDNGKTAQVLIFPYYTVNNGFITSFHIRNTKNDYKAVKLRFREAKMSNDVLDFDVYMSPYDVFTLSVVKGADGRARMITTDKTCTHPLIPVEGVTLKGSFYSFTSDQNALEGYLEVIEMGLVEDGKAEGATNTMYEGIKHISGTDNYFAPKDCSVISTAWKNGYFTQGGALADTANYNKAGKVLAGFYSDESANNPTPGIPDHMLAPTGGLQGYSILLDVAKGASYTVAATALRNYQKDYAQHYLSYDVDFQLLPSLASGNVSTSLVAKDDGEGSVVNKWSSVKADWGLSDPYMAPNYFVPSGINPFPVADVLAAVSVQNDYFTHPLFDGQTDWVLTFPMRKHGIFNGYRYGGFTGKIPATGTTPEIAPVLRFSPLTPGLSQDVKYELEAWNREEFSEYKKTDTLEREVNVLSFMNKNLTTVNTALDSSSAKQVLLENNYTEGWANLVFDSRYNLAALGNSGWLYEFSPANTVGVPVLGFAMIRGKTALNNPNYLGEAVPHIYTRNRGN